jgi:plastocyanin
MTDTPDTAADTEAAEADSPPEANDTAEATETTATETTATETTATETSGGETSDANAATPEPERHRTFWERPAVDRYLVPILLPLIVVAVIVLFILNISRIFLSTHGNVDVVVGALFLLAILIGASILSASPNMRSSSLALIGGGFVLIVLMGGWITIGSSEEKGGGTTTLPAEGPSAGAFATESSNALKFTPPAGTLTTGINKITLTDQGGEHTFHLEDETTLMDTLHVNNAGDSVSGRAFFSKAGDYVFYCTIPGHRQAGMEGILHVSGPTVTLDQAEASSGTGGGQQPGNAPGTSAPAGGAATTTSTP